MKQKNILYFIAVCFAAWCVVVIQAYVLNYARHNEARKYDITGITESDEFRAINISEKWFLAISQFAEDNGLELSEVLSYYMLKNNFDLEDKTIELHDMTTYMKNVTELKGSRQDDWNSVYKAYVAIFDDVRYFPIPESSTEYPINISFADGWGGERYYEDVMHLHEGTDIMAEHERGYVPVVSMTAGVVENVGWLELGGYRIGIRSKNGGYFYYAHLYNYSKKYQIGDTVKAGELLGFMGDSGYGRVEGTVGNFAVHLHVGIYIETTNYKELAVNPFPVLSYMRKSRILYNMQGK